MNTETQQYTLAAWKLPLIVAAIAFSIVAGFYVGGPGLGMAVGALAASSIIVMAIRNPPKPAIAPPVAADGRNRLLLLVDGAMGAAAVTVAAIAAFEGDGGAVEALAVVPLRQGLLDRWACDTERSRKLAEGRLAMVLGALRRAGVRADGRLGDENPVQAIEDVLRSYPATRVALLAPAGSADAAELNARLRVPFTHLRGEAAAEQIPAAERLGANTLPAWETSRSPGA